MTEIRCVKCRRKLFVFNGGTWADIEIKCSKCGHINQIRIEETGLFNGSKPILRFEYSMIYGQKRQRSIPMS